MAVSIDPQEIAHTQATYDVQKLKAQLQKQQKTLAAQKAALKLLKTSLTDFRTSLKDLNKVNDGMLQYKAKVSDENIVDVTAGSNAVKGNYSFFVEQLASAHQLAYEGITDEALAADNSGSLNLKVNGKELDIGLDGIDTLADLADAINKDPDNPGVTASVIRTDGKLVMLISSNDTGAQNKIDVSMSGAALTGAKESQVSPANDLKVRMGDKDSGLLVTRDKNSVDDLIKGVKLEFKQVHKPTDSPLVVDISADSTGTKEQINAFIDSYNKLIDSIDSLTKRGGLNNSNDEKGAFAGDSSIMALKNQLNNEIRQAYSGHNLADFGIKANRDGRLELDSKRLDEVLKEKPHAVSEMFNGDKGLIKSLDKTLDTYLSTTNGQIKMRQDSLDRQESKLDDRAKLIEVRYNNSYNRYLKQFTSLQKMMASMENTKNMFGITD